MLAKSALDILKNRKKIRKRNHIANSWIWTCAFSGRSKFGVRITKCAEKFDGIFNFWRWAHHGSRFSYVSKWPEKWGEFTSIGHFWRILEEQVEILQKQHILVLTKGFLWKEVKLGHYKNMVYSIFDKIRMLSWS